MRWLWWWHVKARHALAVVAWRIRFAAARRVTRTARASRFALHLDAIERQATVERCRLDDWLGWQRRRLTPEGERAWREYRLAMRQPAQHRAPDIPAIGWPEPARPRRRDEWYGTHSGEPYPHVD